MFVKCPEEGAYLENTLYSRRVHRLAGVSGRGNKNEHLAELRTAVRIVKTRTNFSTNLSLHRCVTPELFEINLTAVYMRT